jgi:hypothetical protein
MPSFASYKFLLIFIITSFVIYGNICAQDIVINEVVFSNSGSLTDLDRDSPDWIELYNASANSINLSGYILADNADENDYWECPSYDMPPGTYKVIFASGKNIKSNSEWHTNFKLGLMQEQLFLLNPTYEIIDSTQIQCVPPDKSLSCKPDGNTFNRIVCIPTPNLSNDNSEAININYLPDTLFASHSGGFYNGIIEVELSNLHPENQIFYTLNANAPDQNDSIYTEGLFLDDRTPYPNRFANKPPLSFELGDEILKAQVLRAQVYSDGCPASKQINSTYFIRNIQSNPYNLHVVSLITDKDNLFDDDEGIYVLGNHENYWQRGKEWEREVHVELFDSLGNLIRQQLAGMRIHGGGNRQANQKSIRLYSHDKYAEGWFPSPFKMCKPHIDSCKQLLLRNVKDWDGTIIKDELSNLLVTEMNIDYSAVVTSIVFINGEYWGIYNLHEYQDEYYVGVNYMIPTPELTVIEASPDNIFAKEGDINDYYNLISFIETADKNSDSFYCEMNELIDLESLIDFYCAQIYFANLDFPFRNTNLWKINSDTPSWRYFFFDCDACMERFTHNILNEYGAADDIFFVYDNKYKTILNNLFQNREFQQKFQSKMYYHLNNTFSPERVLAEIEKLEEIYSPLVNEHIYRWHIPSDYIQWKQNIDRLKLFAIERPLIVKELLVSYFGVPFIVYPNPSTDMFTIKLNNHANLALVNITDLYGRNLYESVFEVLDNEIYVNYSLPCGLYFVSLTINNMSFTKKLIVL